MYYLTDDVIMMLAFMFLSGAIGAMIGARRRRAGFGFAMSFLLGPLGWIAAACAADCGPKCPECRGSVNDGARRCCHCGVEIGATAVSRPRAGGAIRVRARRPAVPRPAVARAAAAVACPFCGKPCEPPAAPGTYACPHCGKGIAFE
jgi:hypothetical protein